MHTDHPPFHIDMPISVFEKADADPGKQRRIAGIMSTEVPDRQGEVVLQRGIDFSDFIENGWFNDNHSKVTTDIVGYPESAKRFAKGSELPDGSKANANLTWVEGYLLDTDKANKVWDLSLALQKTSRRLGFSVEGRIDQRTGPNNRIIAKATVRNCAITNCPVNTQSRMEVLAKSMMAMEKALSVGTPVTPGVAPSGTVTGEGAGQVLGREDLEHDVKPDLKKKKKTSVKDGGYAPYLASRQDRASESYMASETAKSMSDSQALHWVRNRVPGVSLATARRVVEVTKAWKRQGSL